MAWVTFVGSIGYLCIPLMPLAILSLDFRVILWSGMIFRPWRLILIAYAMPGVIAMVILHFLPESPKYLLSRVRKEQKAFKKYIENFRKLSGTQR